MNEQERRQALADFLRTRRARLAPEDVGLPSGLRRRTPGLRREEVAQLANIGTSWYISLEQGRDVHPSEQVLESLARALRLNNDERRHLFILALQHVPINVSPAEEQVNPALQQLIHTLEPNPAYILGRRGDILAWNTIAEYIFRFSKIKPPHTRNMVWHFFTDDSQNVKFLTWERAAQGIIAQLRADSARYPGDQWFAQLIEDLCAVSAYFRQWWSKHNVINFSDCHKEIQHPTLGHLEFERVTLQIPGKPEHKIIVYMSDTKIYTKLSSIQIDRLQTASSMP